MKRSVQHRVNQLSMNLLISYLSILSAPLLAIIIIYFTATSLLLSVQKEKMFTTLNMTALEVNRSIEEAGNMGGYISNSPELRELCSKIRQEKDYYDMYLYIRSLSDYSMFNAAIDKIYFFFEKGEYLVMDKVVVPANDRGYASVGVLGSESYQELLDLFRGNVYSKDVLRLRDEGNADKKLMVAQSFPFSGYENPEGTLVVVLNDMIIERQLETNLVHGDGITLMLDREREGEVFQKVITGENCKVSADELPMEYILGKKEGSFSLHGEKYILCAVESPGSPYRYVSILSKKTLLGQIGSIKYLIVALCVTATLAGLSVCIGLWRKRRNVVLSFSRYQDEFGTAQGNGKPARSFWEGVPYLLDSAANLQTTLKLQKSFMHTAVIRKLLLGEYASGEELEADLRSGDITLKGDCYCAAVVQLRSRAASKEPNLWNELRLYVRQYVQEEMGIANCYCEVDPFRFAMVFPMNRDGSRKTIGEILSDFREKLLMEKELETYVGLGRNVREHMEIATSYDDAREITEYLAFHDIRTVMSKEEMPRQTDSFFFPIETELLLVKSIRQGNREEIEDIFRVLAFENFTYRKLSVTMAGYLTDLVRATVLRALKEEEDTCDVPADGINRAESLEEIAKICISILEEISGRKQKKVDQEADALKESIRGAVEEQYSRQEFCLSRLADELELPENRLYKQFKDLFGMSFSEYLENERIKRACELLKNQVPVKDVAQAVGYGSDFSFRRAFKRVMGLAPSYYAEGLDNR